MPDSLPVIPTTGDACTECDGHLVVYSGHTRGAMHVKYFRCWRCKAAPSNNKAVVPASEVPKRRPRRKCPNNVTTSNTNN